MPCWSSTHGEAWSFHPSADDHVLATAELARQAILQVSHTVSVNGFVWSVPGGTGYVMKPDLLILDRGWQCVDELHFDPPPLLVVEFASPSTREGDRSRKLGAAGPGQLVAPPLARPDHPPHPGRRAASG